MISLKIELVNKYRVIALCSFALLPMVIFSQKELDSAEMKYVHEMLSDLPDSIVGANGKTNLLIQRDDAIKIGLFHARRIYGRKLVRKEYPFKIGMVDNNWVLLGDPKFLQKENTVGGTLIIIINPKNGAVVHITHTR